MRTRISTIRELVDVTRLFVTVTYLSTNQAKACALTRSNFSQPTNSGEILMFETCVIGHMYGAHFTSHPMPPARIKQVCM